MKTWKKAAMTAGAIGALGVAGSFGTFSAFSASESVDQPISAGSVDIANNFSLPWSNLGTARRAAYAGANGLGGNGANAGYIKVRNTGTKPINVWLDFDGPVGVANWMQPSTAGLQSTNLLAENIKIDTSWDENFSTLKDDSTRLWLLNRRNLSPLTDANGLVAIAPNDSRTLYFRAWLRERDLSNPDSHEQGDGGADNDMEGLSIGDEKVTVKAIEAGADDFQGFLPTGTGPNPNNYDNGGA
jgi:predicted ribosomally synthesized peptide with SipW-like signal peptide